jgi:ABC transport system ATP-binding/permease protein
MPLLTLERVSLAYGYLPLFDGADLRIEPGERLALIGRNGSGKSSLLKVVAGDVPPDGGTVWRSPGLRVSRLEQDVPAGGERTVFEEVSEGIRDGLGDSWASDHKVDTVISRLGLPAEKRVGELSGGWRRRVALGRALVVEPDLLLLDEPTNHLDIDAIRWLEEFLREYRAALLFVTHDRAFLEALATRIIELDRGRLTSWPGRYSSYVEKKADALEAEARDIERLDKKLVEEEAWLRRGIKARRTRNEGRVRALLALRAQRAAHREQSGAVRMSLTRADASGKVAVEAERVTKALGGTTIVRNLSLRIQRGDRIGLIGPNGSGKTTLLRLLVGELQPDAGEVRHGTRLEIAYFDQQRAQLDPEKTVAESVADGDTVVVNGESRHVLGYLGDFLFPRERARSPVKSLSGGERNRLLLARLLARPANVLVLDEPTNDLDIETLELLEDLVGSFDGTVLLVSHDRIFLDHIVTSTLAFEGDGRVVEYVGGWSDYLRQSMAGGLKTVAASEGRLKPAAATEGRAKAAPVYDSDVGGSTGMNTEVFNRAARRKRTFNEEREFAALPARIDALEKEQAALQEEAASPEFYRSSADHINHVLARIDAIGLELEAALERWVELEEVGRG